MSLRICHLVFYVFAISVSGMIKAIGAEVAKDPHRLSDYFTRTRETTLSSLVGRFIVVGSQPITGKTYRGSVVVTRQDSRLHVRELIDGKARIGIGTIEFEPEAPTLEVLFEKSGIRASYGSWPSRVKQQPRASGWVGLANEGYHDRERLGTEVWYNDQPLPDPASVQRQLSSVLKNQLKTDAELMQVDVGDYRIVGEDTGTGRVYTGKVRVQFTGKRLTIDGSIDGKIARGEMVCFTDSKPALIKYRTGTHSMLSFAGGYGVGENYPRICGYFYPVSDSSQVIPNSSPRLETWFYDWKSSE
ncbi:MAG: hypothetical protein JO025_27140 [Verrucomicrobia bacterium]|nr:hypothetical protein [Verrucomicrobiota bacterium]